jgi:hypothetical protein
MTPAEEVQKFLEEKDTPYQPSRNLYCATTALIQ